MYKFEQKTGNMLKSDGTLLSTGWAGQKEGKNNPNMQNVHGIGPLPVGIYNITAPYKNIHTGPYTMNLVPAPSNEMFDRGDFRIHGAALVNPELSSEGCIVLPREIREQIWNSGDHTVQVVSGV